MMRLAAVIGIAALLWPTLVLAAGCTLPVDVSARIGRAQEFAYDFPGDLGLMNGTRDIVWAADTCNDNLVPASTYSSFYVVGDRAPWRPPYGTDPCIGIAATSTISAGATTVSLSSTAGFGADYAVSIPGAGPSGSTYQGTEVGLPSGNTIAVAPATSTTAMAGTEVSAWVGLAWFQANHPDWVVYLPDQLTPAWAFCKPLTTAANSACDGPGDTPLAIWKSAVQTFLENGDPQYGIAKGIYSGLSLDNVDPKNDFVRGGTCSGIPDTIGCTHAGGTWTARYSTAGTTATGAGTCTAGVYDIPVASSAGFSTAMNSLVRGLNSAGADYFGSVYGVPDGMHIELAPCPTGGDTANGTPVDGYAIIDNQLAADWAAWLTALAAVVHAANWCLMTNLAWDDDDRTNWADLAAIPDIIYDEPGFGGDDSTACQAGGGYFYDTTWRDKESDFAGLAAASVIEGAVCDIQAAGGSTPFSYAPAEILYNLASYLMVKGSHTYQTLNYNPSTAYFEDFTPYFYAAIGSPTAVAAVTNGVYSRTFTNGIAILNPSSTLAEPFALSGAYQDLEQLQYSGTIVVPPKTGLVLLSGAPSKSSVPVQ